MSQGHFFREHSAIRRLAVPLLALALSLAFAAPSLAQTPQPKNEIVPDVWRGDVLRPKPDFRSRERLRVVTDSDYPPFHYFDEEGVLTGFNVDLARAICEALSVECEVRTVEWEDLLGSLERDEADAAVASIRIDGEALRKADFTERYYATPARFIARKESEFKEIFPETLGGAKVGVARGTSHEAYLKQYFPDAELVPFENVEQAQQALKAGEVDLVFGDGVGLTFWLNSVTADGCCEFRGGPYLDSKFFGEGVGIAVKKGNRQLVDILNYALDQVHASGRYEGLLLRYFPMSFF